jgi:hypothetical protein
MEYIVAYLVVSILAGIFIGRFIYAGHSEEEDLDLGVLKKDEKEESGVRSEESREKVSRDLVLK